MLSKFEEFGLTAATVVDKNKFSLTPHHIVPSLLISDPRRVKNSQARPSDTSLAFINGSRLSLICELKNSRNFLEQIEDAGVLAQCGMQIRFIRTSVEAKI